MARQERAGAVATIPARKVLTQAGRGDCFARGTSSPHANAERYGRANPAHSSRQVCRTAGAEAAPGQRSRRAGDRAEKSRGDSGMNIAAQLSVTGRVKRPTFDQEAQRALSWGFRVVELECGRRTLSE